MVKIRLKRLGATKRPFYRVVVADSRAARDGRFIESIGKYHPMEEPSLVEIDADRAMHWLSVGARPTGQVQQLLRVVGVWERFESERPVTAAKVARADAGKAGARTNAKRAAAQESVRAEKAAQAAAAAPPPPPPAPEPESKAPEPPGAEEGVPAEAAAGTAPEPAPEVAEGAAEQGAGEAQPERDAGPESPAEAEAADAESSESE